MISVVPSIRELDQYITRDQSMPELSGKINIQSLIQLPFRVCSGVIRFFYLSAVNMPEKGLRNLDEVIKFYSRIYKLSKNKSKSDD